MKMQVSWRELRFAAWEAMDAACKTNKLAGDRWIAAVREDCRMTRKTSEATKDALKLSQLAGEAYASAKFIYDYFPEEEPKEEPDED